MSKKDKTSEGHVATVWSAFQSLLRLLRIPVPLACAICVAVMLGTSTVKVQSFELPRVLAAVASVIVLIAVYLGAYRAALVLLCLLDETEIMYSRDRKKFDALCLRIRGESSLLNPFSSTQGRFFSGSYITDYVGLVAIHLPMLIVLVCCFWALSEQRAQVPTVLAAMEERKAALAEMNAAGDDVASRRKAAQRLREALDEAKESGIGLMLSSVYDIAALAFVFLYLGFLWRIAWVIIIVNLNDRSKRLIILSVSFVVFVLPFGILHLVSSIQSTRFIVRLWSM